MNHPRRSVLAAVTLALSAACATSDQADSRLSIDFENYELANGLDVVLHVDRSDPVAAVAMTFHVGSAREVAGRTGFAHMFEHLFFLDSENLGQGGLDRLMTRVGSSTNGSTNRDRTNYFETVPIDGLEKTLWAEADKLGFFINTVTESVVEKEKQVVKNEKRQSVDNRPYGHQNFVLDQALYPEGHPYRWQVIGSLVDLDAATLEDVKEFYRRWYGPNNATLLVAGDIDVEQTKDWIEKYFGEIPPVEKVEQPEPPVVSLANSVLLYHEDNFANLPQLAMAWPTVPQYHADSYALDVLAEILSDGKRSPFYRVIVEEEKLAPAVQMVNGSSELAGRLILQIRAFPEVDLDVVREAVGRSFDRFEEEGVPAVDMERVKADFERAFYGRLSSVLGKAFSLAQYNIFAGDPGYVHEDLERTLSVTAEDVLRVYETYLKGRPFVATSFVPKGAVDLTLQGSSMATVVEESIVRGAERDVRVESRADIPRTPSAIDREIEPPYGDAPVLRAPEVWQRELANGMRVFGIESREVPLVQFSIRMDGGLLLESPNRVGAANLLSEIFTAGTANRTPEELELAIQSLGASVTAAVGPESFLISGSTLARGFDETMAIVREIIMEPRWDKQELELARGRTLNRIRQNRASPFSIAADAFRRLLYGDHILGRNVLGEESVVEELGMSDLQEFYAGSLAPSGAAVHVVGDVTPGQVMAALAPLGSEWTGTAPETPTSPSASVEPGLYFVDVPGAKQSILQIGYLALAETDDEFYPAVVTNYRLGGGGFASDFTQVLREQKGYTYGINSSFQGSRRRGPFTIGSAVRSNVTFESLELIKSMLESYGPAFNEEDLAATQGFLLRTNARAFETAGAKLGILAKMSSLGFPADYVLRREETVRQMTIERIRELAAEYIDPERMIWLVVGDAETQLGRLGELGLGDPVVVGRDGRLPVVAQQ
jgi:zinc protease